VADRASSVDTSTGTRHRCTLWAALAGLERGCKANRVAGWEAFQTGQADLATEIHSASLLGSLGPATGYSAKKLDYFPASFDPAWDNLAQMVVVENFETVLLARADTILEDPARIVELQIRQGGPPRIEELRITLEVLPMNFALHYFPSMKNPAILLSTCLQTKAGPDPCFQPQVCVDPGSLVIGSSDSSPPAPPLADSPGQLCSHSLWQTGSRLADGDGKGKDILILYS